jgi:hypothetical protein
MGVGAVVTVPPLPKGLSLGWKFMYPGFILLSLYDVGVVVRRVCLLGFVRCLDLLWLDWGMYIRRFFLHFMMDIFDFFSLQVHYLLTFLFST